MSPRASPDKKADILVGNDGWLFLTGGSNDVATLYGDQRASGIDRSREWADLLVERQAKLSDMGARYVHLAVPEKLTVYGDRADLDTTRGAIVRLDEELRKRGRASILVNPLDFFSRIRSDFLLYWKTDTHWSPWGCFAAYQLLCSRLGIATNAELLRRPFAESEILLDLGGKMSPPIREKARFYRLIKNARRIEANGLVEFKEATNVQNEAGLHVGSRVVYRNDAAAVDETLVLFGDSFSEYRPHLLTGLLAETVREVHFLWSSGIDFGYVERVRPSIVVTELAERFMRVVPGDGIDIEDYARQRLATATANTADGGV